MSKIFGIHFGMHDASGRLHQWVPGDEVPGWAADYVGDHCLILPPADDEPRFDAGGTPADDDDAAVLAAESEGLPSADEDADDDSGEDVAEDPAEPAAEVASLDFTAPAKPKATRGRPAKKA